MKTFRRQFLVSAFRLFDLGILGLSCLIAAIQIWHLTEFSSFASFISMRVKVLNIVVALALFYSWRIVFTAFGLYRSRRLRTQTQEYADVLKATTSAALVLGVAAVIFRVSAFTPAFVGLFWLLASSLILLSRWILRMGLKWARLHGRNLRQMLVIGTNMRAIEFARTIEARHELGYQLIGFVDEAWNGFKDFEENGDKVVCDLEHFPRYLRERIVDEVAIALPMKSYYSRAADIVSMCREQGVIVRVLTNIFDLPPGGTREALLDDLAVATFGGTVFEGWPFVFKRLFDICVSGILLILLMPLLLVVAVAVRLDSRGPVLFLQERVGLNKRRFQVYKFRTMVTNAEKKQAQIEGLNEADGPVFKIKNDPRITRLGKYLRKASIDELPQLLNVLTGEMSLVGPRPLPIRDYQGFDQDWLRRRFSVRPGITCLWQINGRSSLSFQEWMKLDMRYIDSWSFWLDLKILVMTIPAVLRGSGAV